MMKIIFFLLLLFITFLVSEEAMAQPTRLPQITSPLWINSDPLTLDGLKGKVVLVEFWTFACSNCQGMEPHIKYLYSKYHSKGLQVIGIHSPELYFEFDTNRLREYVNNHGIQYPVAVDNNLDNWKRFGIHAWPTAILFDAKGIPQFLQVGEGGYDALEAKIESLCVS